MKTIAPQRRIAYYLTLWCYPPQYGGNNGAGRGQKLGGGVRACYGGDAFSMGGAG